MQVHKTSPSLLRSNHHTALMKMSDPQNIHMDVVPVNVNGSVNWCRRLNLCPPRGGVAGQQVATRHSHLPPKRMYPMQWVHCPLAWGNAPQSNHLAAFSSWECDQQGVANVVSQHWARHIDDLKTEVNDLKGSLYKMKKSLKEAQAALNCEHTQTARLEPELKEAKSRLAATPSTTSMPLFSRVAVIPRPPPQPVAGPSSRPDSLPLAGRIIPATTSASDMLDAMFGPGNWSDNNVLVTVPQPAVSKRWQKSTGYIGSVLHSKIAALWLALRSTRVLYFNCSRLRITKLWTVKLLRVTD